MLVQRATPFEIPRRQLRRLSQRQPQTLDRELPPSLQDLMTKLKKPNRAMMRTKEKIRPTVDDQNASISPAKIQTNRQTISAHVCVCVCACAQACICVSGGGGGGGMARCLMTNLCMSILCVLMSVVLT